MENKVMLFTNLKAFLIFCVVLGHIGGDFTGFSQESANRVFWTIENFIYLFHMPMFLFISGFFSKKLDKIQEKALINILLPYLLFNILFRITSAIVLVDPTLLRLDNLLQPSAGLWYLVALGIQRIFLKSFLQLKYPFVMAVIMSFLIFFMPITCNWVWGRVIGFFPFFLAGYYCNETHIIKIKKVLPYRGLLCLVLIAIVLYIYLGVFNNYNEWYGLLQISGYGISVFNINISLLKGIVTKFVSFCLAFILGGALIIITPNTKTNFSFIGEDTLPLYISHFYIQLVWREKLISLMPIKTLTEKYFASIILTLLCCLFFSSKGYRKLFNYVIYKYKNIMLRN